MPMPPPVGKRPMLDPVSHATLFDNTRDPAHNVFIEGMLYLEHVGHIRGSDTKMYQSAAKRGGKKMSVHCGHTDTPNGRLLVVTASYPNHLPSWGELKLLREVMMPAEMDVMSVFPGSDTHYINDHPYMLWLWEMPSKWGWPPAPPSVLLKQAGLGEINR